MLILNEDGGEVAWMRRQGACNMGGGMVAQTRGKAVWKEDSSVVAQAWRVNSKMCRCLP